MSAFLNILALQRGGRNGLLDDFDRQVVQLVADGESYDEVASLMGTCRESIDAAMGRVRARLGASTDEHAVAIGLRCRMIA